MNLKNINNSKLNILITTAHWKSALTAMRSLAKKGHQISLIDVNPNTPTLYSKYCSKKNVCPSEKDKIKYIAFLLNTLKSEKYDLLIPISDNVNEYCHEYKNEILNYTNMVIPPTDSFLLARNKKDCYKFAIKNNIKIPATQFPENILEFRQNLENTKLPCIIKESRGTGGSGNTYAKTKDDIIKIVNKYSNSKDMPVIQEIINGINTGFIATCYQGDILCFFMFEILREYPNTGGVTVHAKSVLSDKLYRICSDFIKKLNWTGPIDFDLFKTKENEYYIIEINPRLSGTTQFAYNCGVDLPGEILSIHSKNLTNNPSKYKNNIYYRSVFPEEIQSIKEDKTRIKDFLINFFNINTTYDFDLKDFNLLKWQIKNAKWSLATK